MKFKKIKWEGPYVTGVIAGKVGEKLGLSNTVFHIKDRGDDGIILCHFTPFLDLDKPFLYKAKDIDEAKKWQKKSLSLM